MSGRATGPAPSRTCGPPTRSSPRCSTGYRRTSSLGSRGDGRGRTPLPHYAALVRAITGQRLSVKAASAITARLVERFGGRLPTPEEVLADDPDALRTAVGLSRAKVSFLRSLAEHVRDGTLVLDRLDALADDAAAPPRRGPPAVGLIGRRAGHVEEARPAGPGICRGGSPLSLA